MAESRFGSFMRAAGPLPIVVLLALAAAALVFGSRRFERARGSVEPSVAEIKPVHGGVSVDGERLSWVRRLGVGDRVVTDGEGRARLRLDDGSSAVIDRETRLSVRPLGLALEAGRLHLTSPDGARSEIALGDATVLLSGATAGLSNRGAQRTVYAADGELTVRTGDKEIRVQPGETAKIGADGVRVEPERAYDDWTHGLARPWAARGAPRHAVGELWAIDSSTAGDSGSPLTIRSHRVNAKIYQELARTESSTTFFNAGSSRVDGDFRVAVPPGALVSEFTVTRNGVREVGRIALAGRGEPKDRQERGVLEWAGDGWLRGRLSDIEPGQEIAVGIVYAEWLSPRRTGKNVAVQYRYPLAGAGEPPRIGEFSLRVDAGFSSPIAIGAGYGATSDGQVVAVSRSDFRPSADFVVDVEMRRTREHARLYVAPPEPWPSEAGSAVLLRAELPRGDAADGVTLALVIDTSGSIDPALLEAERTLVEALLEGLGARDRVVVLAADQSTRPVGPAALGPVDGARRKAVSAALAGLTPGGASDLGRALEAAADLLPADAPAAMVVYVGDGWSTLGDPGADAIRARLARRANGAPRLGAVAAGPLANRRMLSALAQGNGPLFEIADSADAARVAIELMSDALRPAVAAVELDLGPEVDQVYPRGARAVPAGETLTAVGRIRGAAPRSVKIRYRDARGVHEEVRAVDVIRAEDAAEIRRRWAAQRVEEIVLRGMGREAATDVALAAGLITPWTALRVGGAGEYGPSKLEARVLDLASDGASVLGPVLATPGDVTGTIGALDQVTSSAPSLADGLVTAALRVLDGAAPSVRSCRDSRVALRPELTGALLVRFEVDGDGFPHGVSVRGETREAEDAALDRCVALVVEALRFPVTNLPARVKIERVVRLPPSPRALGPRRCSEVSKLPMPLRRGAWWSRLGGTEPSEVYRAAKQACELTTWTDRRALLELFLLAKSGAAERVATAERLALDGERDAAELIRREALRRVQSPEELAELRNLLLRGERYPGTVFEEHYAAAAGNAARLEVVARFLMLAPHDSRLRRRHVALLEALGKKQELTELARGLRGDPFADALLLCDAASALRRAGFDDEARRTFGELAERAPRDPWVRGLLGDRLRAEGLFDEASAAYAVLDELVPNDARAAVRAALAHASAGRLDVAERLLLRVAQTGGRVGDADLGELARQLGRALAREGSNGEMPIEAAEALSLRRLDRELSQAETSHVLLLRAEAGAPELTIKLEASAGATKEARAPDIAAPTLGLYLYRVSGDRHPLEAYKLSASRPRELDPARPTALRVDTLLAEGPGGRFATERRLLPADGKPIQF